MVERKRANKALSRLRKRIHVLRFRLEALERRYSVCNDLLGSALFREQDPRSGHLAEIMRLKGLKWKNGKVAILERGF